MWQDNEDNEDADVIAKDWIYDALDQEFLRDKNRIGNEIDVEINGMTQQSRRRILLTMWKYFIVELE